MSDDFMRALRRALEPTALRRLAESLREIRTDVQKDDQVRWFQGRSGTEFFSWSDAEGKTIRQQLCFKDTVLEWDIRGGLRAGGLGGARAGTGFGLNEGAILDFSRGSGRIHLEAAREILKSSAIPDELAAPMLDAIARALGSDS